MRLALLAATTVVGLSVAGCSEDDVTLYVALDQTHSEALVRDFEAETGLKVNARFDTEASKTVGLVSAIVEEAERPRCDVFWNNELAHTVRLAQKGLLEAYESPAAATIPAAYKDANGHWAGFAARARILIVNTELLADPSEYPTSMWDLLDPKWKGRCAVARPLTGTTLTHFTALRFVLGEAEFERFWNGLVENEVAFLQSNGATMREVAAGRYAFAFTDTDDFHVALKKGQPVGCVFPDQAEGQPGTMLIPNSVAIVKNGPHPEAARKLVDWILSEQVEARLAAARSAQIPLRAGVEGPPAEQILALDAFRGMVWDPAVTAENLATMAEDFEKRLGQAP